jgi:Domain of unknown function (DUF4835)
MTRLWLILMFALCTCVATRAQELNCNVVINRQKIQSVDQRRFDDMKKSIQDFMNFTPWSNDKFSNDERINCNVIITLEDADPSITRFRGTAQIQSARTVYGSSYESLMLNFVDKSFEFEFTDGQQIVFNPNSYTSSISSLLSFYAYIILGYDYDTFSKGGGLPYFKKAQTIQQIAATGQPVVKGWQQFDAGFTRFQMIENFMNQQVVPFREALYDYHRLGLDLLTTNPDAARKKTIYLLQKVQEVQKVKLQCLIINSFFDSKANEIMNIFLEASPTEKQQAYNLLVQVDGNKADKYIKMVR